jgi:hypothetical protein
MKVPAEKIHTRVRWKERKKDREKNSSFQNNEH